jgi:hypothetical protein
LASIHSTKLKKLTHSGTVWGSFGLWYSQKVTCGVGVWLRLGFRLLKMYLNLPKWSQFLGNSKKFYKFKEILALGVQGAHFNHGNATVFEQG